MKKNSISLIAIPVVLLLLSGYAHARDAGEEAKIDYLIRSVQELQGVKFIRNGTEYDSTKAAEHLRYKLRKAGARVKTAEDFIILNSRSLISGEAYRMKFPDGTVITAESFFRDRLKQYK